MPDATPAAKLLNEATHALHEGRFSEAAEILTQAIAKSRDAVEKATAFRLRAAAYARTENPERAIPDYAAVIAMPEATANQKFMAFFGRAVVYERLDQTERALADYAAAKTVPGVSPAVEISIRRNHALSCIGRGQFDRALAQFEIILAMPDLPLDERASCLGTGVTWCHYSLGDFPRAIEAARGAVALHPAHRMSRFNLAICLLAQGDHVDESLEHYRLAAAASISREQLLHDGLADLRRLVEKTPALAGAKEALALLEARLAQLPEHSESEH